jgi:hypothetical protein
MSTAKHDPAKERFWRTMLRRWRQSGVSIRAFCQEEDLAEPSFYCWRRILTLRDAEKTQFVPVRLADASEPTPTTPATAGVELVLAGGRSVRVAPGFDAPTLKRLLALLEEGQS